jgi:hypothetical protein
MNNHSPDQDCLPLKRARAVWGRGAGGGWTERLLTLKDYFSRVQMLNDRPPTVNYEFVASDIARSVGREKDESPNEFVRATRAREAGALFKPLEKWIRSVDAVRS